MEAAASLFEALQQESEHNQPLDLRGLQHTLKSLGIKASLELLGEVLSPERNKRDAQRVTAGVFGAKQFEPLKFPEFLAEFANTCDWSQDPRALRRIRKKLARKQRREEKAYA